MLHEKVKHGHVKDNYLGYQVNYSLYKGKALAKLKELLAI